MIINTIFVTISYDKKSTSEPISENFFKSTTFNMGHSILCTQI